MSLDPFRKAILPLLFSMLIVEASGQDSLSKKYAKTIVTGDLEKHLNILASDSLGGRGTGQIGQELAAAYLAHQFQAIGLSPPIETDSADSFFQWIIFERIKSAEAQVEYRGESFNTRQHILSDGRKSIPELTAFKTVFIGRGREKDLDNLRLKGKAVVLYGESPKKRKEIMARAKNRGARVFLAFNTKNQDHFERFRSQSNSNKSIRALQLAVPDSDQTVSMIIPPQLAANLAGLEMEQLIAVIESETALSDMKIRAKSQTVQINARPEKEIIRAANVLGFLPGSDKKSEIIVVTAHYDHLGRTGDVIFNGADDDGSGTSAILEIAQAFSLAAQDGQIARRSLLFMAVTAEENGLLGSRFYVENPVFGLHNTVVNLNIDMIGRTDDRHDDEDYVYIIGSDKLSRDLHELSESVNIRFSQLQLDYRYDDERDPNRFYYRSDHYNFAKNKIPVIFYFGGVHQDYHRPTDTVDKIQFSKIEKTARLIFHTAWEIANREHRIKTN